MNVRIGKFILVAVFALSISAFFAFNLDQYFTLETLKAEQSELRSLYNEMPIRFALSFSAIYVLIAALAIPGATVLTLASGFFFGFWPGLVMASVSSTIGACLSFLASRFLFREFVTRHFGDRIRKIDEGIAREGALYLFTIRLVPVFPFFLVNLALGITQIRLRTFAFVSQIGMLAGTAVYVNAGTQLGQLQSLRGILSPSLIASFLLVGFLPLIAKSIIRFFKSRKYLRRHSKPKNFDYNMIAIGGGSAGLVASYIGAAVNAKVALIEKHKMGGDCLNTGCVPSKAFIRSAKVFNYFHRANEFGIDSLTAKLDFAKVMERVQRVVKEIEPHDSVDRYTKLGVECFAGNAKIRSPYEVEVNGKILTTKNIVVATGAGPYVPNIPGLKDVSYLTSDNVWSLRELPKRLIVLGGGPIGCELAQSFARFGSHVTLVEMADRIMSKEDDDVSALVTEQFTREGISVRTSHKALRVEVEAKALVCEFDGREIRIPFDEILIALGRKANVTGFGLEELNIEISRQGTIVADEYLRTTNYPNIYVCGDVTGPFQFTHTASHQAWFVAVNALFSPFKKFKVDYKVIPWCTFTDPEVARVGLNEQEAKANGIAYIVSKYGIDDLDRAIAEGEAHGFVKVLTKPGSDKILGATIVGSHAGDIVCEYVTAMKHGLGMNKILSTIHIYPTLAEANKYAAGVWKRQSAPQNVLRILSWFHRWRRT